MDKTIILYSALLGLALVFVVRTFFRGGKREEATSMHLDPADGYVPEDFPPDAA